MVDVARNWTIFGSTMRKKQHFLIYWLTTLVLNSLRILTWMPYSWQMCCGRWLGRRLYRKNKKLYHVANTNISLCFPELSPKEKEIFLQKNFESLGMGFFETLLAIFASNKRVKRLIHSVTGLDEISNTLANKQGVILLFPHFVSIYLIGRALGLHSNIPFSLMYHSPRNPALNDFMFKHLQKHCDKVFTRKDTRNMIKHLRTVHTVWYAPDLDLGRKFSIFIPFFNVPAATLIAPSKIAKISNAQIIPIAFYRCEDGKSYKINIKPALENFPTENEKQDMIRINKTIEDIIQQQPEQYLWQYKRFNTRPEGEEKWY